MFYNIVIWLLENTKIKQEMIEMAYETKENTGSLFANGNKKGDKHPDYTGKAMIGGNLLQVAGWINESKSGTNYMSLKFSEFTPRTDEDVEYVTTAPDNAKVPF